MDLTDGNRLLGPLPDEGWVQSEGIPTRRFATPALLTVITFLYDRAGAEDDPKPPPYWVLTDRETGAIRVWAETAVVDPLPDGWKAVGAGHVRAIERVRGRDALATISERYARVVDAFFAGEPGDPEDRLQVDLALRTLLRPDVRPWVFACCDDFFTWLAA